MFPELSKAYEPEAVEARWSKAWYENPWFVASNSADDQRRTWSLVIPPPNVTGSLHMGHMLEHTQIDALTRWRRMLGDNALWLPGTDHAGIATQMVVERSLAERGLQRREMGRDAFVAAVWEWKERYGERIKEQMIRLGCSCDWTRERFTLDAALSRAVRQAFVTLYDDGLIYRGRYIVNWCPRCQTAVSDLEVKHEEITGKLYFVRYPLAGAKDEFVTIATTRPETILADVAVAVHPSDERYRPLIGRQLEAPLTHRLIPILADELAKPEFGTGAVKVTPGHDPNDFAAGQRHNLEQLVVMDERGHMNATAGGYAGLDRFEARKRVVHDLEQQGLLARADDHPMSIGRCQRCNTIVEPRISMQWFVRTKPLAEEAAAAVQQGLIQFQPPNNTKIFLDWMANIHDWCISRQLWWGHRIPAWYCDACNKSVVALADPTSCAGCSGSLRRDEDVLDTWFSSGLWPFSTLGWPDRTPDLAKFYPTSALNTGFDILFFWVARMAMLGIYLLRKDGCSLSEAIPFRQVYIHALVRDAERQKMSKTKGNVIDPLEITAKYGTDAVRFTLAAMSMPGTDIALSEARMEGYAAFVNKIWNAGRFIFMSLDRLEQHGRWKPSRHEERCERLVAVGSHPVDRWIYARLSAVAASVESSMQAFRFHEAADTLYHFFWHEFCDWYLELVKLRLNGSDATAASVAADNLLGVFEAVLRLLHPFTPFVTEELWQALHGGQPPQPTIALAAYPRIEADSADSTAERQMVALQAVVNQIRSLRAEWKVAPKTRLAVRIAPHQSQIGDDLRTHAEALQALAGIDRLELVRGPLSGLGSANMSECDLQLDLRGAIDVVADLARLRKELVNMRQSLENARRQLASETFRAKAPKEVLAETERRAEELARNVDRAEQNIKSLETLQ